MMKKDSEFSVRKQIFIGNIVIGILWIAVGILGWFDGKLCSILQKVFMLGGLVALIIFWRVKKEATDEMADEHYLRAKAKAGDFLHAALLVSILTVLAIALFIPQSKEWKWPVIMAWSFFALICVQRLVTGIIFEELER